MLNVRRVVAFLALSLPALQSSVAGILSTPSVTQTPVMQTPVTVMEFYHAGLDHYFITADTAEAGALDAGIHPGWIRTGYQFTTYSPGSGGTVNSVCRFYGRPDAGLDSHFYTGSLDECTAVLRRFSSSWALESGNVFRVQLPDLATGACPSGTSPVFRLFNNRSDANHRYTIDVSVKNAMVSRGYTSEGYGTEGVVFCAIGAAPSTPPAPTPTGSTTASIIVTVVTADTFDFSSVATASTDTAIVSYAWDFGDGTTATGSTSSHTYTVSGTYPVVLTVTDSKGAVANATKSVNATATPPTTTPPTPGTPPVVIPPPPTSAPVVVLMPPAASFVNSSGTWTFIGGQAYLNGQPKSGGTGDLMEGIGDTVYLHGGGSWSQWFSGSRYFGTGFAPISVWGNTDPATYVLAPAPPYVGPSNTPNIWEIELTSFAAVQAKASYTLNPAYPANQEYLTDAFGIKYLRFSSNPDPAQWDQTYGQNGYSGPANILLTWFLRLGASGETTRTSVHVRYLLWLEDDVAPAVNTTGIKLPGAINQSFNPTGDPDYPVRMYLRMFMRFPQSNTFSAADHIEDIEMMPPQGNGQPIITDLGIQGGSNLHYKTNRWYVIEQESVLNTVGVANGVIRYWINGNLIYERTNVLLRDRPDTLLRSFHVDIYHGGLDTPKGLMHMRLAKLAVSSSYIGVPAELLASTSSPGPTTTTPSPGTYSSPEWRKSMTSRDAFYQIPNTAQMNGIPDAGGAVTPLTIGKNSQDIDTWNGFAADSTSWWGAAMGGHNGQWSNKVVKIDLSAPAPAWVMEYAGSPYSSVPSYQQMDSGNLDYYFDGLPTSRHTYYANHYIGKRNRVMMFYDGASYGGISHPSAVVDGYRIADKQYDPAGTWQTGAIYSGYGANARVPAAAKHPVSEDVYLSNNGVWKKWTQSTGLWSDLAPTGLSYPYWQGNGSVIDGSRNRWCSFVNATMQCIDLATMVGSTKAVTGDPNFAVNAALAASAGSGVVHDLDNDRYLLFLGYKYEGVVQVPGRVYAINPQTAVATKIADIPASANGVLTRVAYFQALGGVAYLPEYNSSILFMPTR